MLVILYVKYVYSMFFFFPHKKKTHKYKVTRVASNSVCFSVRRYIIYPFPKWAHFFLISIGCRLIVQQTKMMLVLQFIHVKNKSHSHDH